MKTSSFFTISPRRALCNQTASFAPVSAYVAPSTRDSDLLIHALLLCSASSRVGFA